MSKKVKVGLFGFGCVGQGFYELVKRNAEANLEIKKIVVRNADKQRDIDPIYFSTSTTDIIDDPEIDIVVELIDDPAAAFNILKHSLAKRKPVVTANKRMLAENLEEIFWLQKKYQTPVLYEGAVCGSIPIIRNLESHFALDELKSIEGIFNGSTNYILTKMVEQKKHFQDALQEAQELGFAETDPTLDVKGFDPKFKLVIAIAHAFGLLIRPQQVINFGIDHITEHDLRFARQHNYTIKLIAKTEKIGNKVFALVAPQFVPLEDPLAQVKNEYNAVNVTSASLGLQVLIGKGAGKLPTGHVVLADVASITTGGRYHYPKIIKTRSCSFDEDLLINVHVSFTGQSDISLSDFEEFNGGFQSPHQQSMNGWITAQKLKNWSERKGLSVILNSGKNIRPREVKKEAEFSLA